MRLIYIKSGVIGKTKLIPSGKHAKLWEHTKSYATRKKRLTYNIINYKINKTFIDFSKGTPYNDLQL